MNSGTNTVTWTDDGRTDGLKKGRKREEKEKDYQIIRRTIVFSGKLASSSDVGFMNRVCSGPSWKKGAFQRIQKGTEFQCLSLQSHYQALNHRWTLGGARMENEQSETLTKRCHHQLLHTIIVHRRGGPTSRDNQHVGRWMVGRKDGGKPR